MSHFLHSNFLLHVCYELGYPEGPKVRVGLLDITIWATPPPFGPFNYEDRRLRLRAWEIKGFVMKKIVSLIPDGHLMRKIILCHKGPLSRVH